MTITRALDVDELANEIRRVDGNHNLGAGALAEALMPFLQVQAAPVAEPVAWVHPAQLTKGTPGDIQASRSRDNIAQIPLYTAPPHDAELVELLRKLHPYVRGCSAELWDEYRAKLATLRHV